MVVNSGCSEVEGKALAQVMCGLVAEKNEAVEFGVCSVSRASVMLAWR
jgi:hypothetical protein